MAKYFLYLFGFIVISTGLFAQNDTGSDIRLAHEYYRTKDYDKALVLFDKLYESTNAKIYFTYYANCLIELSRYDEAEKEIKKQIRKNRNDPSYSIDLGYLYKIQNAPEKAKEIFDDVLKNLSYNPSMIRSVASQFMQRREYEYAQETYLKGRSISSEQFRNELANVYAFQRKYEEMIYEYLDWLEEYPNNLSIVQNQMQYFIDKDINDEFSEILRRQLLKRIQKLNSSIVYNRMLVWFFIQRREFAGALVQEKAIDKRFDSGGKDIVELAETAKSNNDFETALDAYNYVISKGLNKPYYIDANVGKLNLYYLKVINGIIKTNEEIIELEKNYLTVFNNLGLSFHTIQSVLDLAHLQTFYLNKPQAGERLLEEAINLRDLHPSMVAMCKIELGDVLVYQNDLDYAALIYGQAEKENKDNIHGDNAKLKKAKLAYYANNFRWAKAQFDALKESTSKPVANDALFYSILISDNTEGDSLQSAMKTYARAELLVFRNKNLSAINVLDSLIDNNPGHQITDEAYLLKAKIFVKEKNYDEAVRYYKKIMTEYSWDILADLAMYNLAVLYEENIGNKEEAAEYYKKLMLEHPDSIYATDARRRFRAIRNIES